MTPCRGALQRRPGPIVGLALAAGAAGTALAFGEGDEATAVSVNSVTLGYQALKNWDVIVPNELWTQVETEIPIPHAGGEGFAVEQTGLMKLRVDRNGDGKLDSTVRGSEDFLELRGETPEGQSFLYAVRFRNEGGKYRFAPSGLMSGKLANTTIGLIDRNVNGRYDDYGQDAMLVGSSDGASLLSRVVNADGELYEIEVSPDGSRVEYRPYSGATATLDVHSGHDCHGELVSAVIERHEGDVFFNAAASDGALKVPAGDYSLVFGFAERGGESVMMRRGKMLPIHLNPNDARVVEWGGPLVAEFDHVVDGEEVTVRPNVAFYGTLGEEYHTFQPDAKSPKIVIADKKTKEIYDTGRFGGC